MPLIETVIGIGSAIAAGITKAAFVNIGPDQIGVKVNRVTGKIEPILSDQTMIRDRVFMVEREVYGIEVGNRFLPLDNQVSRQIIRGDEPKRTSIAESLNMTPEQLLGAFGKRRVQITTIQPTPTREPRQGWVFRVPLVQRIAKLPYGTQAVDTAEGNLQVPVIIDGKRVEGVKPDLTMTYRVNPEGAGNLIRHFPSFSAFTDAVEGVGRAVAHQMVGGRAYEELFGENVPKLNQYGREAAARLLYEKGVADTLELKNISLQGVRLPDEFVSRTAQTAADILMRDQLGQESFIRLASIRTAAGGKGSLIILPGDGETRTLDQAALTGAIINKLSP